MTQTTVPTALNRAARRQKARKPTSARRQPRQITANVMDVVRYRVAALTQDEISRVMGPVDAGFRALREGVARFEQWQEVMQAMTLAQVIEDSGIVRGLAGHLQLARTALDAIYSRVTQQAGWGTRTTLHFDEINALREALELFRFQLQHVSAQELNEQLLPRAESILTAKAPPPKAEPAAHQEKLL